MSNEMELEERATLAKQEIALVFSTKPAATGTEGTDNPPEEKDDTAEGRPGTLARWLAKVEEPEARVGAGRERPSGSELRSGPGREGARPSDYAHACRSSARSRSPAVEGRHQFRDLRRYFSPLEMQGSWMVGRRPASPGSGVVLSRLGHQEQVSNLGTSGPPLAHHDPEGPRPGRPLPLDGRHPLALQVRRH